MKILAKTFPGLEAVLQKEIESLGGTNIQQRKRAVSFEGDKSLLYRSNLHLRTALRLLVPIHYFKCQDAEALYKGIQQIDWGQYLEVNDTLAIDSVVFSKYFKHSHYVALKAKDAIVDQFRALYGKRPSVHLESPSLRVSVHISHEHCTISLDSSGESLHKRGYRQGGAPAPLNEVLAAGMIALSNWKTDTPFVDLTCGSGTLVIEAAMKRAALPPGINRGFGFMRWKNFDQDLWDKILQAVKPVPKEQFAFKLAGIDIERSNIQLARKYARNAGVLGHIQWTHHDFRDFQPAFDDAGTIIVNPPYGERLRPDAINQLYKALGDSFKQKFQGFSAWVLSSNSQALKAVGLKPDEKILLYNGALECSFNHYELYEGSKISK